MEINQQQLDLAQESEQRPQLLENQEKIQLMNKQQMSSIRNECCEVVWQALKRHKVHAYKTQLLV